jgi:hypothetical protein
MAHAAFGATAGRFAGYSATAGPITDRHRAWLAVARHLAWLMDARFSIFGFRFGLDPIFGLFPVAGDVVSLLVSLYLLGLAVQVRVPPVKLLQIILNAAADFGIGLVPVAGRIGDAMFRSHMRNLRIIEDHMSRFDDVVEAEITRR